MSEILDFAWNEVPYVVFDTETSGLGSMNRICEISFVLAQRGEILDSYTTRVNPGRAIDPEASAIHGITDADVAGAPAFIDVLDNALDYLCRDVPWVAHNLLFDIGMLRHDVPPDRWPRGIPTLCTLQASRRFSAGRRHRLIDVAERFGIEFEEEKAHGALYDASITARLVPLLLGSRRVGSYYTKWSEDWLV